MRSNHPNFFSPDWPCPPFVRSVVTYRFGGYSKKPYASNNMAIHVGDDIEIVQSNREKLSQTLSLPRQPIWLNQVHGNKIINVTHDYSLSDGDGFYCKELDKPCGILTADCLPILICSTKNKEIAAIHAGWRGLGSGIIKRALDMFESSSEDVIAYLGPAISSEVFEVGYEVREYFCDHAENLVEKNRIKAAFAKRGENKLLADLYELARMDFELYGISKIYGGNFCSYRKSEFFYSYRRDGITGRNASIIWLK